MLINMAFHGEQMEEKLSSVVLLSPIVYTHYSKNPLLEHYESYWRSFGTSMAGKSIYELWGKGFQDRVGN